MEPICRYVDLINQTFGGGNGQLHGYPGHPEIELALIRLYKRTKNQEYLKLARYFLEERGNPKGMDGEHYYDWEAQKRGEGEHEQPAYFPAPRSYWYGLVSISLLSIMLTSILKVQSISQAYIGARDYQGSFSPGNVPSHSCC